ncbi:hypothetical protein FocTR4_00009371 [Fusarium oxysporum f. sp. cubense]|uniref:Uncharacterized protein n=1 Tax=Fusarium oxysporum f. sp. cubense TaxID=61366 RepID=A0A5C6STR5_FUSOC|nr:hypothetical protein FocTR4_00009371 [Fusarium oxysporum f. sp. cubense]
MLNHHQIGPPSPHCLNKKCVQATAEDKIAGDQWEDACRRIAEEGYDCADGERKCYANPDKVHGRC